MILYIRPSSLIRQCIFGTIVDQLPNPSEVQSWLEWAGGRMLSIQVHGARPSSYRSFWPDYPDDQSTAYGYTPARMRAPSLNSSEVVLMDEILSLVSLTPNILQRRILNARALVHPLNNRHLYSWAKIAILIHSERRAVKLLHKRGLEILSQSVPSPVLYRVRSSLFFGPSLST